MGGQAEMAMCGAWSADRAAHNCKVSRDDVGLFEGNMCLWQGSKPKVCCRDQQHARHVCNSKSASVSWFGKLAGGEFNSSNKS
jgi:hypothetical protein